MSFSSPLVIAAVVAAFIGIAGPSAAGAQTPPIKTGLWEITQIGASAAQASRAADSLAKLPPAHARRSRR